MHGPSLSLPLMRVSLAVDPWLSGDADKDAAWDEAPSASLLRLFRPSALSVPPLQRSSGINDRARLAFVALLCLLLGAVAAISAMALLRLPSATERVPRPRAYGRDCPSRRIRFPHCPWPRRAC